MADSDREPQADARDGESRGMRIAAGLFKMFAISILFGIGVFLLIMAGLHPAALLKPQTFFVGNPQAFHLAWQAGTGAGIIYLAIYWSKFR
jgi:hypothetical protein